MNEGHDLPADLVLSRCTIAADPNRTAEPLVRVETSTQIINHPNVVAEP
jgi:hypothetical protein